MSPSRTIGESGEISPGKEYAGEVMATGFRLGLAIVVLIGLAAATLTTGCNSKEKEYEQQLAEAKRKRVESTPQEEQAVVRTLEAFEAIMRTGNPDKMRLVMPSEWRDDISDQKLRSFSETLEKYEYEYSLVEFRTDEGMAVAPFWPNADVNVKVTGTIFGQKKSQNLTASLSNSGDGKWRVYSFPFYLEN